MLLTSPGRMEIEEAVAKKMKGKDEKGMEIEVKNVIAIEALDEKPEDAAKEFKNTEDFKPGGLGDQGKEEDGANPTGDGCEEDDANGDIDAEDEDEADEEDSDSVSENFQKDQLALFKIIECVIAFRCLLCKMVGVFFAANGVFYMYMNHVCRTDLSYEF